MNENEIGTIVVNTAFHIHKNLGPGLLESVYEAVLMRSLVKKGLSVQRQIPISIEFEGERFDEGFRIDLFINEKVIIELKSVEKIIPVYKKQLLTYLKLTKTKLGYLINFGEEVMKDGIVRIINGIID